METAEPKMIPNIEVSVKRSVKGICHSATAITNTEYVSSNHNQVTYGLILKESYPDSLAVHEEQ